AALGDRRQRGHHRPYHGRRRERRADLVLELVDEQGELERLRHAALHELALRRERDVGLEHLFHLERRADRDAYVRGLGAGVREVMHLARWDYDGLAGLSDD